MNVEPTNLLERIATAHNKMSHSEQKVADLVLTLPEAALTMSMRHLAKHAGVSDTTVLRFCRLIGCKGYSDFKIALARTSAPNPVGSRSTDLEAGELANATTKTLSGHVEYLAGSGAFDSIDEIGRLIANSDRTYLFAFGVSMIPALDLKHQLDSLDVRAEVLSDPHVQAMRTRCVTPASTVVFLSLGHSRLLTKMADLSKEKGANTVAITPKGTPVAAACDLLVPLVILDGTQANNRRQGRYMQLITVDLIVASVLRAMDRAEEVVRNPDTLAEAAY